MTGDRSTILVASPDPDEIARFRSWLGDEYRVETVTNGDDALALLEDADVSVIDCELETASESTVVAELERREAAYATAILDGIERRSDCRPDTADLLGKPVAKADFLETVARLVRRARYDDLIAECATLAAERGMLEARSGEDRESTAADTTLQQRLDEVLAELDELIGTFDGDDFRAAFATCTAGGTDGAQRAGNRF